MAWQMYMPRSRRRGGLGRDLWSFAGISPFVWAGEFFSHRCFSVFGNVLDQESVCCQKALLQLQYLSPKREGGEKIRFLLSKIYPGPISKTAVAI
tara:strand:+ start:1315 stop:1599 length:285 start_codon:yes stop_codon:yes gene_type:complete